MGRGARGTEWWAWSVKVERGGGQGPWGDGRLSAHSAPRTAPRPEAPAAEALHTSSPSRALGSSEPSRGRRGGRRRAAWTTWTPISGLAVVMLLETELSGDRDLQQASMATAGCSLGRTRGKGPREPLGLQPRQDDPMGETTRTAESGRGMVGREGPRHSRERKKFWRNHGGWGEVAPMRDGNRGEGMRVWQILWAEGLEFAAVAPEGCCGAPRAQTGPCRHCWEEGIGQSGDISFLQRPHTPQLSHTAQQCSPTPGLGLPPKSPSQGPLDRHGRWKITEALLAGRPDAEHVGRPPPGPTAACPFPLKPHMAPLGRALQQLTLGGQHPCAPSTRLPGWCTLALSSGNSVLHREACSAGGMSLCSDPWGWLCRDLGGHRAFPAHSLPGLPLW